jgi:hypothetical protein
MLRAERKIESSFSMQRHFESMTKELKLPPKRSPL